MEGMMNRQELIKVIEEAVRKEGMSLEINDGGACPWAIEREKNRIVFNPTCMIKIHKLCEYTKEDISHDIKASLEHEKMHMKIKDIEPFFPDGMHVFSWAACEEDYINRHINKIHGHTKDFKCMMEIYKTSEDIWDRDKIDLIKYVEGKSTKDCVVAGEALGTLCTFAEHGLDPHPFEEECKIINQTKSMNDIPHCMEKVAELHQ
jgi:hypothetical protein